MNLELNKAEVQLILLALESLQKMLEIIGNETKEAMQTEINKLSKKLFEA